MSREIKIAVYRAGKLVSKFGSQKDAATYLGINAGLVSRALKRETAYYHGYRFERIDYVPRTKNIKVDLWHHGNMLCTYDSIKKASDATKISTGAICQALKEEIGKVGDYIFKKHKDERKRIKR